MKDTIFYKQAHLLLSILEEVFSEPNIAMKGGTAINMFVQNLPRLSVDVDLTYTALADRETTLFAINSAFTNINNRLRKLPNISTEMKYSPNKVAKQIIIFQSYVAVKIEINHIFRGSVYPIIEAPLCDKAQDIFKRFCVVPVLSKEDLYAGKICAALDRQHPRDLFDVYIFLNNDTFSEKLKYAFLVYLISHNRPIVELLNPNRINIADLYNKEFLGMTEEPISLLQLEDTRELLIESIRKSLTTSDKEFLLSVKAGDPKWDLLPIEGISTLPSVQWKLTNLKNMNKEKRSKYLNKLSRELET